MINDYVKTSLPLHLDKDAEQIIVNPSFTAWTGAAPNDTPDGYTVTGGTANITEDALGMAVSGTFNIYQDVMTVGNEYLVIVYMDNYVDGELNIADGTPVTTDFMNITSDGIHVATHTATDTELEIRDTDPGGSDYDVRFVCVIDITGGLELRKQCKEMDCCDPNTDVIHVLTDALHFPPFQVKSTVEDASPVLVLYDATTDTPVNPQPAAMTDLLADIDIYNDGEYTWYIYEAAVPLANSFTEGDYYLLMTITDGTGSDVLYSQEIRVCGFTADIDESVSFTDCEEYNPTDFLRLEWWSDCDFDNIVYQYGYRNRLWLDAILDTPRPEITKDTNDNDNNFTANYMSLKNFYQLKILVPEFMYDALIRLPLYGSEGANGHVSLTTPNGDCGELHEINITAEWQENSCLCYMTIEFLDEEYPVKMGNCCDDYDLSLTT